MRNSFNFHWQNLNDKPGGRQGLGLRHGRAWLRAFGVGFNWEWGILRRQCVGISVRATQAEEVGFGFSLGLPFLFSIYLTVWGSWFSALSCWLLAKSKAGYHDRQLSLRFHDAAIWWDVWRDTDSWTSGTPIYRSGCFHIDDFLLGKSKYATCIIATTDTLVALPEASYAAKITLVEATWKRPRWFARRLLRADVDVPGGIPFPGKGENSWDCGQDAVFGISCNAATVEAAVARLVESVLKDRRRYGGSVNWKPAESLGVT